jgi:hypothetical protein
MSTDALQDPSIIEAVEGMRLRFENVSITNNDAGFGEWSFSSDGTEDNAIKADDRSDAIEEAYAASTFNTGDMVSFIQGIGWFSFSEFKLIPESADTDIGEITPTDVEDEVLPGSFTLHQNFPNPFNPTTTIRYDLGQATQVTLEVYDALGRRVATLVDGFVAAGEYTATFSAKDLASGLYLYRLTAGDQVTMKKMVLLK